MLPQLTESWDTQRPDDLGLNSLEHLGAFFTSQIHDLNNQVAVLSNAELLLPPSTSQTPEMVVFLDNLFVSIRRLSSSCQQFNDIRKKYPVEVEKVRLAEAVESITGAVGDCKGWLADGLPTGRDHVWLNPDWLPCIIGQLIAHMPSERGVVRLSLGELPPRHYQYNLRSQYQEGPERALLVHFQGQKSNDPALSAMDSPDFPIALELIRLLGAAISLHRSDSPHDYLLAFRLVG